MFLPTGLRPAAGPIPSTPPFGLRAWGDGLHVAIVSVSSSFVGGTLAFAMRFVSTSSPRATGAVNLP